MVILRPLIHKTCMESRVSSQEPSTIHITCMETRVSSWEPSTKSYTGKWEALFRTSAQLWRIVQLVERLTEKPNAILTRVQVPGAVRDFSTKVNFRCKLSYGVRTAPVCNRMFQQLCACSKFPVPAAIPLFGHTTILHTLIGMGSADLAAAVPYSSKTIRISRTGQCNTGRKLQRPKGRKSAQSDSVHSQGCSQGCSTECREGRVYEKQNSHCLPPYTRIHVLCSPWSP